MFNIFHDGGASTIFAVYSLLLLFLEVLYLYYSWSRPMISYSRNELFMIRRISHCSPSERIFADLRRAGLLHLRGCRAGRRDFIHGIKVIASNRSEVDGPRHAPEHAEGVNKNNLISIPVLPNC